MWFRQALKLKGDENKLEEDLLTVCGGEYEMDDYIRYVVLSLIIPVICFFPSCLHSLSIHLPSTISKGRTHKLLNSVMEMGNNVKIRTPLTILIQ